MKKATLSLLSLVAVMSSLLYAQQKKSTEISTEFIELAGAKLHLGMAKADVAEGLPGSQIRKVNEDQWLVMGTGEVHFKNAKLVFAERSWLIKGIDPVDALFGVVSSLNGEGYRSCSVSTDTQASPGSTFQRVWIDCGRKSVLILKGKIGDDSVEDVSERLGTFTEDSK